MHLETIICEDVASSPHALDGPSTLVLAFGGRAALEATGAHASLRSAFPTSILAGCSTAGQFVGDVLVDEPLVVCVARFERTTLRATTAELVDVGDSELVGERLGSELDADDLCAVVALSDGTTANGTALVAGLTSVLDPRVVVVGGLAGDGDRFERTVVVDDDGVGGARVTAVGLYGRHLVVRSGSGGGWEPFGPERTITGSDRSTLRSLDGEPALDLYERYLADRAAELPGSALLFPLAVGAPGTAPAHRVVRTVLGVDHDDRSMTFAGDVPEGWRAQLMRASFDALVGGAAEAGGALDLPGEVTGDLLCLGVSCVGRRLLLGNRAEDELAAVVDRLDPRAGFAGFYSYGEIAAGRSGRSELHNQTMTLTMIGEA